MTDDEQLIRAKDATRYDLIGMPDERFELMVSRLIRLEFPRSFKPANTSDGGADQVLRHEDGPGCERCWQCKHFPKAINWKKCKASLAAARKSWEPAHYTFVFPRELTIGEQKTFDRHFRAAGADITVDYWNGEELQFRLCASDDGQRVAKTFFGHVVDDHERTVRAIEAQGRLDTPGDALDRLLNIGGALAGNDAYFMYPAALHEPERAGPPVTPGTVMSFLKSDGRVVSRIEVVPRDDEAMELYGPQFSVRGTDDAAGELAAQRLREALSEGKTVEIEQGLEVTPTQMPPGLAELVGQPLRGVAVQVGPVKRKRTSWRARIRAATDEGEQSLNVLMRPLDVVPDGWNDAFAGEYGGLTITLLVRRRDDQSEVRVNLRHQRNGSLVRHQLAAMRFLNAVSTSGDFAMSSIERPDSPEMLFPGMAKPTSDDARDLLVFLENVRVIEEWSDAELSLPDDITATDARDVAVVAQLVRNRGRSITWQSLEATVRSVRLLHEGRLVRVERGTMARVLGQVVDLGYLRMHLTDYRVVSKRPTAGQTEHLVRIEPRSDASSRAFEQLAREKTDAKRRPPPPPRRKGNRAGKRRRKGAP